MPWASSPRRKIYIAYPDVSRTWGSLLAPTITAARTGISTSMALRERDENCLWHWCHHFRQHSGLQLARNLPPSSPLEDARRTFDSHCTDKDLHPDLPTLFVESYKLQHYHKRSNELRQRARLDSCSKKGAVLVTCIPNHPGLTIANGEKMHACGVRYPVYCVRALHQLWEARGTWRCPKRRPLKWLLQCWGWTVPKPQWCERFSVARKALWLAAQEVGRYVWHISQQCLFEPFVLESFGRFGNRTRSLFNLIVDRVQASKDSWSALFLWRIIGKYELLWLCM